MRESLHVPFVVLLNVCILETEVFEQTMHASVLCDMHHPARTVACVTNKFSGKLYISYIFISCKIVLKHVTLIGKYVMQPARTWKS